MRFYLTTRPLLICHPTMQLISNVSNLKIWVSHQDDLESWLASGELVLSE